MLPETHTRLATPTDIPTLCDLLALLFTQEIEFTPNRAAQTRGLDLIIQQPKLGRITVIEHQGSVVGMVNLLYTVSTALGEPVAILEDLILHPSQRGNGLGGQLIAAAETQAKADGCHRITLLTDHNNLAGQAFYQHHGFTHSSMRVMRKALI